MKIAYQQSFIRQFNKLPDDLQKEVLLKIKAFEKNPKDKSLKSHKLNGRFKKYQSFSVNYSHRIIFETYKGKAFLLEIGNHDIYK